MARVSKIEKVPTRLEKVLLSIVRAASIDQERRPVQRMFMSFGPNKLEDCTPNASGINDEVPC